MGSANIEAMPNSENLEVPLTMMGAPGSPYTRKMRSLMRYRHIPYRMVLQNSPEAASLPGAKVPLLPTFYLPNAGGEIVATTDSTPLIRRFEKAFPGRSAIPSDPVIAFLDELLEDYADEWLTRCMFHYRWYHAADIDKAARVLPNWAAGKSTDEFIAPIQKMIAKRQTSRLHVVGSNEITAPVIEESYRRFLRLLDRHLQSHRFLLGEQPASSDFASHGQLTCLALFDPTPSAIALEESPRVCAWVEIIEDLSGLNDPADANWISRDAIPETLRALLAEVGRVHAPTLLANADALESGAEQMEAVVDGLPWVQKPFPYQGKCLGWLRESHARLSAGDRGVVDDILAGTGCESLFA
jgi:glutathione S-transferase